MLIIIELLVEYSYSFQSHSKRGWSRIQHKFSSRLNLNTKLDFLTCIAASQIPSPTTRRARFTLISCRLHNDFWKTEACQSVISTRFWRKRDETLSPIQTSKGILFKCSYMPPLTSSDASRSALSCSMSVHCDTPSLAHWRRRISNCCCCCRYLATSPRRRHHCTNEFCHQASTLTTADKHIRTEMCYCVSPTIIIIIRHHHHHHHHEWRQRPGTCKVLDLVCKFWSTHKIVYFTAVLKGHLTQRWAVIWLL